MLGSIPELMELDGCLTFREQLKSGFKELQSNNIVTHFDHTGQANDSAVEMQGTAKNIYKKLTDHKFLL